MKIRKFIDKSKFLAKAYLKFKVIKTFNFYSKQNLSSSISKYNSNLKNNNQLIFLYQNQSRYNGSTYMRAFQLSEMLKQKGNFNCECLSEKSLKNIKDSIVIINKGYLSSISRRDLKILKKKII